MQHAPETFFLGQRIISTVIVLYKDDVLVGLIISQANRIGLNRIESSNHSVSDWSASKSTCSVTKQSNLVIDRASLCLSCIRLVKVSKSLYSKNYNIIVDQTVWTFYDQEIFA